MLNIKRKPIKSDEAHKHEVEKKKKCISGTRPRTQKTKGVAEIQIVVAC